MPVVHEGVENTVETKHPGKLTRAGGSGRVFSRWDLKSAMGLATCRNWECAVKERVLRRVISKLRGGVGWG